MPDRSSILCGSFLVATSLLSSGCADYETAFLASEDVRIELPGDWGLRAAGDQGDVYLLIEATTADVNGWVTETVEAVSEGVEVLNRIHETSREDGFRVYGPWTDTLGRDVNWVFKVEGDETHTAYEIWVAGVTTWKRDEFELMLAGDLVIDGDQLERRSGGFFIDFDVLERHPGVKRWDKQQNHYGGVIEVSFSRDTTTLEKTIELAYDEFWVDVAGEDVYMSDETYRYARAADGSGSFELALTSSFEAQAWSGPGIERMQLESRWDASEAGRARGAIVEQDGGDLSGGDMFIDECFTAEGSLVWRAINEPYATELPGYNLGDEAACAVPASL